MRGTRIRQVSSTSSCVTVHPRVCGEHIGHGQPFTTVTSPVHPRVCGEQPKDMSDALNNARFIPACAGNTPPPANMRGLIAVHPRVCGEHVSIPATLIPILIAGNTTVSIHGHGPVHPRVCGEHVMEEVAKFPDYGSSPRVRGTRLDDMKSSFEYRFIPACAGNTVSVWSAAACCTVHPRVCGEHPTPPYNHRNRTGSSPRVRGTLLELHACNFLNRFIPACAGNTRKTISHGMEKTVHPRVCGEHSATVLDESTNKKRFIPACAGNTARTGGSQGIQQTRFIPACAGNTTSVMIAPTCHVIRRFIPACAGNTRCFLSNLPVSLNLVHPRVCGEHSMHLSTMPIKVPRFIPACAGNTVGSCCWNAERNQSGSSPRVRGTRHFTLAYAVPRDNPVHPRVCGEHGVTVSKWPGIWWQRFIPACAGNTSSIRIPSNLLHTVHPRVCGETHGKNK